MRGNRWKRQAWTVLAGVLALACHPAARAQSTGWDIRVTSPALPGQQGMIELWAAFPPGDHALAGTRLDVLAAEGAFSNLELVAPFTGPGGNPGTINGSAVTGIIAGQLHFPPVLFADSRNPILVWRAKWNTANFTPRCVEVRTATAQFDVYIDRNQPTQQSRLAGLVEGLSRIPVGQPSCDPEPCEPWTHAPSQREPASAAYGGCAGPTGISLPDEGEPIHFACGEFYVNAEDMRIKGRGLDLVWARTYGSHTGPDSAQGQGWDFSYNISVAADGAAMVLSNGWGRKTRYSPAGVNTWAAPDYFRLLTRHPGGDFTLAFADKSRWNLLPLNGAPAQGKVSSIVDRNGNALTFAYDGAGRLVTITDTLGRAVTVAYTPAGRVASVTDFTGRQVVYTYSASGDLLTARSPLVTGTPHGNDFPGGKTTTYTYSSGFADERLNHNLLTVRDPRGNVVVTNTYHPTLNPADFNFDRVTRHVRGDPGDIIDVVYVPQTPDPNNNFAVVKAIINDRVGNVREFSYDARRRGVIYDFFTGRADPDQPTTATTNRPINPLRPADPPFFRTYAEYNADSMVTRLIHPNLNETVCVFDAGNADRRAQGNLLEHRRVAGPLGGDQAVISEFFEYAAGLGGCCGTNFVTRHVDPRGNETRHTYDANGNRLSTVHRIAAIVENWEYNAFGQVTKHILPDNATGGGCRRVDTYSYYTSGPQNGYLRQVVQDATDPAACAGPHFNITRVYEYDARGNVVRAIDPRGNDALTTFNQLDQPVQELSRPGGGGVRIERLFFYDANDNLVREDAENRDENGVRSIANTHFSTVTDFETLNRPVRVCREVGSANLAGTVLTCGAIPPQVAAQFITDEFAYDANRNALLERYGEAVSSVQPSNTLAMLYDERDFLYRETRAPGVPGPGGQSTTQHDYDANGNQTRMLTGLEGSPRETLIEFDGFDRPVRGTDPMGNAAEYRWDPSSNLGGNRSENPPMPHPFALRILGELNDTQGSKSNVRLGESMMVYDAMGRLVREDERHFDPATQTNIGDGQATETTVYSHLSAVLSITNDNGNTETMAYDTAGRPRLATDARGNTTTTSYDANSNVVAVVELERSDLGAPDQSFTTTSAYDALDRLVSTTDNSGNTRQTRYDSRNNPVLETDALGRHSRKTYDGLSRLVRAVKDMNGNGLFTDAADIATAQSWDRSGRLHSQADDRGNVTRYQYDALNRLVRVTFADGTVEQHAYDVHDNRVQSTDPNGTVATSAYDLNDRPVSRTIARAAGVLGTTLELYLYDGSSRVVRAEDNDSLVTREYDSVGHLTSESQQILPAGPVRTVRSLYDGEGNRTRLEYPSGRVIASTYDAREREKRITDGVGGPLIAEYHYVGPQRVHRIDRGNGTRTDYTYDGITGIPNPPGDAGVKRIIRTRHTVVASGAVIDDRTYAWDAENNKKARKDERAAGPRRTHDYAYDAGDRLVRTLARLPGGTILRDERYDLDGAGNRLSVTGGPNPGTYAWNAVLPEPADSQMNQYTGTPMDTRTYDKNGNLVVSTPGSADLNGDLRLDILDFLAFQNLFAQHDPQADFQRDGRFDIYDFLSFQNAFAAGLIGAGASGLSYDYRNQLVEHRAGPGGPVTRYAYDALGRRIEKTLNATTTPVRTRYYHDNKQEIEEQDGAGATVATYVYGLYVDEVLTMRRGGTEYHFHTDDLYNVMAATGAGGTVVERYDYGDYGVPEFYAPGGNPRAQSAIGNPNLFTGRRYDPETGWYYYRTRHLDPKAGRFTTRDSIGIWGDKDSLGNGYAYAGSNPWSAVDPEGTRKSKAERKAARHERKEARQERREDRKEARKEKREARKDRRAERREERRERREQRRAQEKAWWQVAAKISVAIIKYPLLLIRFTLTQFNHLLTWNFKPGAIRAAIKKKPFYGFYCGYEPDTPPTDPPKDSLDACCHTHDGCARTWSIAVSFRKDERECNYNLCQCAKTTCWEYPDYWSRESRECRSARQDVIFVFCGRPR